jgi:hypothetical protein
MVRIDTYTQLLLDARAARKLKRAQTSDEDRYRHPFANMPTPKQLGGALQSCSRTMIPRIEY